MRRASGRTRGTRRPRKELVDDHRRRARQRPQARPVPQRSAAEGSAAREAALTRQRCDTLRRSPGLCRPEEDRRGLHDTSAEGGRRRRPRRGPGRRTISRTGTRRSPPQTDEYRALSQAHFAILQAGRRRRSCSRSPAGKPIKPGSARHRGFLPIADRRSQRERLSPGKRCAHAAALHRRRLVAAVKRLQADCGIKPDGVIGETTLDALNLGPAGSRAAAGDQHGAAALARARPAGDADRRQYRGERSSNIGATARTSIAATSSSASRTSRRRSSRRRSRSSSPIRSGACPDSIAAKELASKSSGWLAGRTISRSRTAATSSSPGPRTRSASSSSTWRTTQQIYLHDTPAKALFAAARAASQPRLRPRPECARSSRRMLAQQDGVFDKFQEAMASGDENVA